MDPRMPVARVDATLLGPAFHLDRDALGALVATTFVQNCGRGEGTAAKRDTKSVQNDVGWGAESTSARTAWQRSELRAHDEYSRLLISRLSASGGGSNWRAPLSSTLLSSTWRRYHYHVAISFIVPAAQKCSLPLFARPWVSFGGKIALG